MASALKLVSWNVNGIRAISKKGDLQSYLASENPDVLCLQEVRAELNQIPADILELEGYHKFWNPCASKKGYSGVAILTKEKPELVSTGFGVDRFDVEGRVIRADYGEFVLFSVYFPNGKLPGRLEYKLDFYDAFFRHCETLRAQGRKIIVCGDYNTAHKEIDLARPKENVDVSGFMPVEREKIDHIVSNGWVDTFRQFNTLPDIYSWWSTQQRARERNVGWRIDYFFVTDTLMPSVVMADVQDDVAGSDHCPVTLEVSL